MKKKALSLVLVLCMLFGVFSTGCAGAQQGLNVIDDKYRNFYEIFVYSYCAPTGISTLG